MENTLMRWDQLLSGVRLRDRKVKDRTKDNEYDLRNDFDDDYTRLVISSAVRRLQDKAQVFPLDNSDFVRTRLTHSHEVATIGRSLGISVEKYLHKQKPQAFQEESVGKLSALLAVAGLVHDLGNPPFGHFGEAAIQNFFRDWFNEDNVKKLTSVALQNVEQMQADFENFEGNAQSFRLLTKLNGLVDEYSYNLSAASLASILKYPRSSLEGNKKKKERQAKKLGISYKKFGYMTSEQDRFELVREYTGILSFRHPATFLLEAADDIAYSAADIEDGCKKKVLDYSIITDVFAEFFTTEEEKNLLDSFRNDFKQNTEERRSDRLDNAVQKLRIKAQGLMIHGVVETFLLTHDKILNGEFDDEILEKSKAAKVREAFRTLAENYIFPNQEIITRELVGGKVIRGLLEIFVSSVSSDNIYDGKELERDIFKFHDEFARSEKGKNFMLISDNYRYLMQKYPFSLQADKSPSLYDRLLLVTDFVCGMTDTYALELYQKLSGIKL